MWRHGRPSNVVSEAGVIVRQLDELVRKGFREWEPCPSEMWCGKFGKIWPSSIINKNFNKAVYCGGPGARREEAAVGFVLAPPPINHLWCAYPSDANSMGAIEHEFKAQQKSGLKAAYHGCGSGCRPPEEVQGCSFAPEQLEMALKRNAEDVDIGRFKYNEIVMDAERMKAALPHSLLGVFYMDEDTKAQATGIHAAFLATYKLTSDEFPLMHLSLSEGFRAG